jgi:hypothetical protein
MGNHYSSIDRTTLTYDMSNVPGLIQSFDLFVTNAPDTSSQSNATVHVYGLTFESFLGLPRDYVRTLADSGMDPHSYVIVDKSNAPQEGGRNASPVVTFDQLSPVQYKVQVTNATGLFVLVLDETFDPLWQLNGNPTVVAGAHHILADGFANGWIISASGSFGFTIDYGPRQSFLAAYYLSLALSLGFVIFAGWILFQRKNKKTQVAVLLAAVPESKETPKVPYFTEKFWELL